MADRTRRQQALALAAMGLNIFPLPPKRKTPYTAAENSERWAWRQLATKEPSIIEAWFEETPDMNYGINPGEEFVVVDLDDKDGKNGSENFCALNYEQDFDQYVFSKDEPDAAGCKWVFETFAVLTPSGGYHLYLRTPHAIGNSNRMLPEGVDIRGAGGYVVGPGCWTEELASDGGKIKTHRGTYKILVEAEIAQIPDWLLAKLDQHYEVDRAETVALIELDLPCNVTRATEFLSTRAPAIEGNNGDDHTYKTIAKVKDCGISEDKALELLMLPGGWNTRCVPPWPATELVAKAKHVYRYGQNAPGNKDDLMGRPDAFSAEEWMKAAVLADKAARSKLDDILMSSGEILASDDFAEMVIPCFLPADSFTTIISTRGAGKTVIMMDMACRLASDMDWHDMPMRRDFAAVYICGEYPIGAREMHRAWCIKNPDMILSPDRFMFFGGTCDLLSRDSVESWTKFLISKLNGRRAAVFIDTWQKATSMGDQSDNVIMQTAVHHAEALGRSVRGPVVLAAHPPKSGGKEKSLLTVMGSSVIENGTAGILHLSQEGGIRKLYVDRIKGKGQGEYEEFAFDEVDLKRKDPYFGKTLTAVVPKRVGGSTTAGSAAEIERDEIKRQAWAEAIRDLLKIEMATDPEAAKKFTLVMFAKLFVELPRGHLIRSKLEGISGEHLSDALQIRDRFKQVYGRGGPILIDNNTLMMHTIGCRFQFSLRPSNEL